LALSCILVRKGQSHVSPKRHQPSITEIAALFVGTAGHVTSIDLDQASIETAQRRGAAFGFENTSFHRADIAEYVPSSPFDAIIGRLVLQFVPDPIAIIKRLYGMLRPGGILALQEPTWKLWLTYPAHLPLRRSVTKAARDAFQAGGASTEMEQQICQGFIASGLHAPQLRVELPLGNSPEFRSLLGSPCSPDAQYHREGADDWSFGRLNTLKDRLDQELDKENSFASYVALIGAFGHK
jgi:SAM-dependent methyltransferase